MGEGQSGGKWPSREEIKGDPQRPGNPSREGQGGYGGEGSDGVERRAGDERDAPKRDDAGRGSEREVIGHPGEEEGREPIRRKD